MTEEAEGKKKPVVVTEVKEAPITSSPSPEVPAPKPKKGESK